MRYTLGDTTDTTGTDTGPGGQPSLLQQLVTGFTQFKLGQQQLATAQQITQENILRSRAGLPPLDYQSIAAVPSVSVGLAPGTQQLITYGLLALGGIVVLNMLLKRR